MVTVAGTFPNAVSLNCYYPDFYSNLCTLCNSKANLHHMLRSCHDLQKAAIPNNSIGDISTLGKFIIKAKKQWDTILLSSAPEPQLIAVRMAEAGDRIQRILTDS